MTDYVCIVGLDEAEANDYMIGRDGTRYLLEVNHIPNVTRFPEIWAAYRDTVVGWVADEAGS